MMIRIQGTHIPLAYEKVRIWDAVRRDPSEEIYLYRVEDFPSTEI
jgi:hypothetical protein